MIFPGGRKLLAALIGLAVAATPTAAWAAADPILTDPSQAPTATQVQAAVAQLTALQNAADRDAEAYDAANQQLTADRVLAQVADREVASEAAQVAALQRQVDAFAAAAYSEGSGALPAALVASGGPGAFMQRLSTLQEVGQRQGQLLDQLRAARAALRAQQQTAHAELAAAAAQTRALAGLARQLRAEVAAATQLVATMKRQRAEAQALIALTGSNTTARAELPQILALLAQDVAALRQLHADANTAGPAAGGRDGTYQIPEAGTPKVLALALGQLGKPYQWGAAGPKRFDCSGLTMWLWAQVGQSLPHNAAEQYTQLPHVALTRMVPGDLVFFLDPNGHHGTYVGHVGVYLGFGLMLDAPHTGAFVRVERVWSNVVGAARVP